MTDSKKVKNKPPANVVILREAAGVGLKSRHFWKLYLLGLFFIYCTLFYYLGELLTLLRWDFLKSNFFYGTHDIRRAFFLVPIIYAAYAFRTKGAVIAVLVSSLVILFQLLFSFSPADSILRTALFIVFAGVVGFLSSVIFNKLNRHHSPAPPP